MLDEVVSKPSSSLRNEAPKATGRPRLPQRAPRFEICVARSLHHLPAGKRQNTHTSFGCALSGLQRCRNRHQFGLGFSALSSGLVVDDGMRIDTWSFGLRAYAALDIDIAPGISIGPLVAFFAHDAPVDATTFYNRALRGTRHLRFAVGARFAF